MERYNDTPTLSGKDLTRATERIHEGQMLQFAGAGFKLYEYVETGEADLQTVHAGESEYVFRVPIKEPVLQKDVATIDDLIGEPTQQELQWQQYYEEQRRLRDAQLELGPEEYQEWANTLTTKQQVLEAAKELLQLQDITEAEALITCHNCKGNKQFVHKCSCTYGGTTFLDITDESDGEKTTLREEGVAAPDCETCGGTGSSTNDCPCCNGYGKIAKYPQLILVNEATGEERVITFDVAALVANGEVEVSDYLHEQNLENGTLRDVRKALVFKVGVYLDAHLADMGIDKQNAARFFHGATYEVDTNRANVSAGEAYWRKYRGDTYTGSEYGAVQRRARKKLDAKKELPEAPMTGKEIVAKAQQHLAISFVSPFTKTADGFTPGEIDRWVIRPRRPIEQTFSDLKTAINELGYTLGFTHSFIATGQVGPSFFMLDQHGNVAQQLSNDYGLRDSLENAWLTFVEIKKVLSGEE